MEVKRKVISMEERDVIQEARTTITLLQTAFSKGFTPSSDTLRFRENLDQMLKGLRKARRVDNRLLIKLEKFYQTASLLIGLGGLALNEEAFQAWRAYDHWHYEVVKPQLQVYGGVVVDTSLVLVHRYSEEVLVMVVLHDFLHQLTLSFWNFYYSLFFLFEK